MNVHIGITHIALSWYASETCGLNKWKWMNEGGFTDLWICQCGLPAILAHCNFQRFGVAWKTIEWNAYKQMQIRKEKLGQWHLQWFPFKA